MKEAATIVAVDGATVWVETQRRGTCNACVVQKGCGQGMLNKLMPHRVHYVRALCEPGVQLAIGDRVELCVPEHLVLKSSALVYLLPLALLLAGSLLGDSLWPGDTGAALGGALGLLTGFALVRLRHYQLRDDIRLQPKVHPLGAAGRDVPSAVVTPTPSPGQH